MYSTTPQPSHQAKRRRAPSSGIQLTGEDASRILGMYQRGDRQHDIAAFHAVDSGRIHEIANGDKFRETAPMPAHLLPPEGPYVLLVRATIDQLKAELAARST